MILFISNSRESAPIAQRMEEEGTPTYFYIHDPTYKSNFDGILQNKIDVGGLISALKKCDVVLFDITQHNRQKPHDFRLLNKFGIRTKTKDLFGSLADKLKKDHLVIGASQLASKLEWDREWGIEFARRLGLDIPRYEVFESVMEGIRFLGSSEGQKNLWVLKPWDDAETEWTYCETYEGELIDILKNNILRKFGERFKFMVQEKIEGGVEYATEMWQDENSPVFYTRTLESKKLADGDMSKATGSQQNTYWITDNLDKKMSTAMKRLWEFTADDYVGMTDVNCIYKEDKRYFLEFTRRFGWSSTYLCCSLVPEHNLSTFFLNGFRAVFKPGEVVSSQVVSLWPYPGGSPKDLQENIKGNLINHDLKQLKNFWLQDVYGDEDGCLRCCGSDGLVGVMTGKGDDVESSINTLFRNLNKLEITGNQQWRTQPDHLAEMDKRMKLLRKWDVETF